MNLFNLVRWKNLLLIALIQFLIRFALFEPFEIDLALNLFNFFLLVTASLSIAAAGNIINDIYDVETDSINKPEKVLIGTTISEKLAYNLYFVLNIIGVGIGFYLSYKTGKNSYFPIFVLISASLYVYSSYLKQAPFIGNIIISVLVATSILIVGIFDLLPVMTPENKSTQKLFFDILFDYAIFAFLVNLVREMIKDIEDVNGDYKAQMNTLPIIFGRERAKQMAFTVSFFPLAAIIYFIVTYLYKQQIAVGYFLVFVLAPMLYATIKIFGAKTKIHFSHISTTYKVVMLFGMLSLLLYPFILK
ncbi:geranylgeranylglycerol-phosphate geranylgeranyltransferase [uncultured Psychroserpens sp.]|uniref:geranylgeranylglycerol-phosphate geranylgeranyltransferase n=1 Tax=uncultured Psychroserpens sp. TaxID=255436 RepID=UPI00262B839A|nr:geranylgeranylglycerol-phosphate geranylgeranyltransferase [uncultured Psychroserpens sp.]